MEEIVKYRTIDGVEFYTTQEALAYEAMLEEILAAERIIRTQDDYNSSEGVQNTAEAIVEFSKAFRTLLVRHARELVDKWDANPKGIIGRYLSDGGTPVYKKLNSLYYSCVLCVGNDGKSYGQPYFAYRA